MTYLELKGRAKGFSLSAECRSGKITHFIYQTSIHYLRSLGPVREGHLRVVEARARNRKALSFPVLIIILAMTLFPCHSVAQLPSVTVPNGIGVNIHNTREKLAVLQTMYSIGIRYIR